MSVINMSKNIKQFHQDYLICYKSGTFYHSYDKDAYIISNIFDYSIKKVNNDTLVSGFPRNAISKVMARLEREKINYMIIDTRNNYDVDKKEEFGNLNKYTEIFEKSHKTVNLRKRVYKIEEKLLKELDIEKIRKIENMVYESRKV